MYLQRNLFLNASELFIQLYFTPEYVFFYAICFTIFFCLFLLLFRRTLLNCTNYLKYLYIKTQRIAKDAANQKRSNLTIYHLKRYGNIFEFYLILFASVFITFFVTNLLYFTLFPRTCYKGNIIYFQQITDRVTRVLRLCVFSDALTMQTKI